MGTSMAGRLTNIGIPGPDSSTARTLVGESWRQAIARVGGFLEDLPLRWEGGRVLIIGHIATRWALDHYLRGVSLRTLVEGDFTWQEG
jgi:2,3-bisphosphoglycerate-dependent phosphoglycerate mutase